MKFSAAAISLACKALVSAQSSPGAPYNIGTYLPMTWNKTIQNEPGMLFDPLQVANGPKFGTPQIDASHEQLFVSIMIDIDVVLNESTGVQSQFLHELRPNLGITNNPNDDLTIQASAPDASTVIGASYFTPMPPPGHVHNYNVFLFKQPAEFTIPPAFARFNEPADIYARILFNLTQFANASGLGQPVAANYFRVLNSTAAQFSAAESQTATRGIAFPSGFTFPPTTSATDRSHEEL